MPKWITAIFALFLSIQVFGARGKGVNTFLAAYFNPDTISRVKQSIPAKTKGFCQINSSRNIRFPIFKPGNFFSSAPPVTGPEKAAPAVVFPTRK